MISRRLVDARASELIKEGASASGILKALLGMGAARCVAQDWAGEPRRRELLQYCYVDRKTRRLMRIRIRSRRRGRAYKNILTVKNEQGREVVYHATKGRRSFRAARG